MKRLLVTGAALAIGVAGMGVSNAKQGDPGTKSDSGFKVTGGGQIITDEQEAAGGPGDTVGFNAQETVGNDPASPDTDDAARGQFQYNPHGGANPQNQPANEKFHGIVTCLISGGEAVENEEAEGDEYEEELVAGMARFGGYIRGTGTDPVTNPYRYFTVDVTDNGQGGGPDAEDDLLLVRLTAAPCADNPENEDSENQQDLFDLGRGNVKIHNNPDDAEPAAVARATASMVRAAL